ncbi:MAG: UDP-N-acetylenolpyruvoylglucosamine reductase, partial [Actinomycetes bacterium]
MTPTTGSALVDALEAVVPGAVARAVPASELSTYRLGGPFEVVVRVPDAASLARLVPLVADVPCLVIGRGSNLLVADTGYPGVGLVLAGEFD